MTTADDNGQLVRRIIEDGFNEDRFEVFDDVLAADVVLHEAGQPDPLQGTEEVKAFFRTYRTAFPDATIHIDELLAADDLVVVRWTGTGTHDGDLHGIGPTGAEVSIMGMEMYRVADGRIVEGWAVFDSLGMLQQVGAIPEDLSAVQAAADD